MMSNPYGKGEGEIDNPFGIHPEAKMVYDVLYPNKELCEFGMESGSEDDELRIVPFLGHTDEFLITSNWILSNLEFMKSLNKGTSSYGLKHMMERDIGLYVTNGMFICAMLACGYRGRGNSGPNLYFNVRGASVNRIEKRLR